MWENEERKADNKNFRLSSLRWGVEKEPSSGALFAFSFSRRVETECKNVSNCKPHCECKQTNFDVINRQRRQGIHCLRKLSITPSQRLDSAFFLLFCVKELGKQTIWVQLLSCYCHSSSFPPTTTSLLTHKRGKFVSGGRIIIRKPRQSVFAENGIKACALSRLNIRREARAGVRWAVESSHLKPALTAATFSIHFTNGKEFHSC